MSFFMRIQIVAATFSCFAALAAAEPVNFEQQVRPIFEKSCYSCHGPKKQEAGLRLDQLEAALKGSEAGPVILPGKSGQSKLIEMVSGTGDVVMPKKGERLTAEQINVLKGWIDQGAVWPDNAAGTEKTEKEHWAFKKPVKPAVPSVKNARWVRNEIDRFVLARLEKEKLKPAPEADKLTLLRRMHLDLVGLPPKLAQVEALQKDPKAFEKTIEKLLASPHYGERWGRHWLDAARYADSDGFEKDKSRAVHFYRDYVINSLNKDLPYNQFVIEQLAGDLLPSAKQDQIVATGFLRNSMVNEEGGVDPEQFRMEAMFDRMDAVGKSFLGLTIQCAQCHNHKFDPLTQEEYYKMFAFLNNDHEPQVAVYTPMEQEKRREILAKISELEKSLWNSETEAKLEAWEKSLQLPEWEVVKPVVEDITTGGQRYLPQEDGSFLAQGYAPTKHTVKLWLTNETANIRAFRVELLNDPNLPLNGPGRSFKGTSALTEFAVEAAPLSAKTNKTKVKFEKALADYNQPERKLEKNFDDRSTNNRVTGPVKYAIDGNGLTAWGIDEGPGRRNQQRQAVFVCAANINYEGGSLVTISLKQDHGGWNSDDHMNNNLGRFRISVSSAEKFEELLPLAIEKILKMPKENRSKAQKATLFSHYRTTVSEWKEINDQIEALWKEYPEGSTTLALQARADPRETQLLRRGDFLKPIRKVEPGVPEFLHPLRKSDEPPRLQFAKWLADEESPTTARVIVNRVWQKYFGMGLVSTPEDLGLQSETPSHPELLDWLAVNFMENRWSLKHLHRTILNSATYRQSSVGTPEKLEKDPYNRLLARASRLRVEAEIVRDIALSASGLLNAKVGGRSVMPPAPDFLFKPPASYAPFNWVVEKDDEKYRRAIYTFRRRSTPYPMLQTFDAPNGDFSCVQRLRSNTPLQALVMLNEPLFVKAAQALAKKTLSEAGTTDDQRLVYAFRTCLTRAPGEAEKRDLLEFLEHQRKRLAEGWLEPSKISGAPVDPAKLPKGANPTELAAWTAVSRVLLNLDETITKE